MGPEELIEIHAIEQLKYRYARLLDTKDWAGMAELFVPEATASYGGGQYSFDGRDAIMGFLKAALGSERALTSHTMSQPEIELLGDGRARGIWALQDIVLLLDMGISVRGASYYDDTYVKVGGAWRFSHTGYKRVWEQMAPIQAEATMTADWFSTNGMSTLPAPDGAPT